MNAFGASLNQFAQSNNAFMNADFSNDNAFGNVESDYSNDDLFMKTK